MLGADIRDLNWQQLRARVSGLREVVHQALLRHGPCTTRQLAERSGLDLLTVRPRVTELVELGFAECTGREASDGIYRALSYTEAAAKFSEQRAIVSGQGIQLEFTVKS